MRLWKETCPRHKTHADPPDGAIVVNGLYHELQRSFFRNRARPPRAAARARDAGAPRRKRRRVRPAARASARKTRDARARTGPRARPPQCATAPTTPSLFHAPLGSSTRRSRRGGARGRPAPRLLLIRATRRPRNGGRAGGGRRGATDCTPRTLQPPARAAVPETRLKHGRLVPPNAVKNI